MAEPNYPIHKDTISFKWSIHKQFPFNNTEAT